MQATLSMPSTYSSASADMQSASAALSRTVDSAELLKGQKAVEIIHNGSVYRLQSTRLGKLILTK